DLAHDFQVIYLTCSDRYDAVADSVVELAAPTGMDDEAENAQAPNLVLTESEVAAALVESTRAAGSAGADAHEPGGPGGSGEGGAPTAQGGLFDEPLMAPSAADNGASPAGDAAGAVGEAP